MRAAPGKRGRVLPIPIVRVGGADGEQHLLPAQQVGLARGEGGDGVGGDEPQIQALLQQQPGEGRQPLLRDLDAVVRENGVEAGNHLRQDRKAELGGDAHGDVPPMIQGGDVLAELLFDAQHLFCGLGVELPRGSEDQLAPGPEKQGRPQLLFQAGQVLAEGGLGDIELLRGPGHVPLLGDGENVCQISGVHGGSFPAAESQRDQSHFPIAPITFSNWPSLAFCCTMIIAESETLEKGKTMRRR